MMDSLKPYEKMKPSGLPWLGEIPEHWNLTPNRALLRRRKVLVGEKHADYKLLSLTKQGVIVRDLTNMKGKFSADMGTSQEVRPGDLVFCLFDVPETPRTVGLSRVPGMITGAYTVFEPAGVATAGYLELFYRAMDDRKLLSPLYSGLRNTIPVQSFLGTKSPQPPSEEQKAIVDFVNHTELRINRAISAKQKTIGLLNEQKQAIVHQAVTRGLNPSVPLKPSGLPWLGDIPEHWAQRPLWTVSRERSEKNPGDLPLLSVFLDRGVIPYGQGGGQVHAPSLDLSNYQVVREGDLVLNNQQAWRGSVGISAHSGIISPAYIVLELDGCLSQQFASFLFRSRALVDQFVVASKGVGDIQRQVFKPFLRLVQVPVPPKNEQEEIAGTLSREFHGINGALAELDREIQLLLEYRTTLISDVVTGKLDVREAAKSLTALDEDPLELADAPTGDVEDELELAEPL